MEARNKIHPDSEYWVSAFDAIPAGLSIHGIDGTILSANDALGSIYGTSPAQLLGRTCGDLFHQASPDCPHEQILQFRGQAEARTNRYPRTDDIGHRSRPRDTSGNHLRILGILAHAKPAWRGRPQRALHYTA